MSEKKIMIVDDHEDSRFVLRAVLENCGYRVVEAHDGEEAVSLARSKIPDLILMDIRLPGINGFQATESIHSHRNSKEIPVIALTANVFDSATQPRVSRHFHSCLSKPIRPKELLDHIRSVIGEP